MDATTTTAAQRRGPAHWPSTGPERAVTKSGPAKAMAAVSESGR